MPRNDSPDDVVLGRTLVETAFLNSPERRAGEAARTAVQRRTTGLSRGRVFRNAMVALVILALLTAASAVVLRPILAP